MSIDETEAITSDQLLAPVTVNGRTVKNRFVLPAMQRGLQDFAPTPAMVNRLRLCAEGGAGLVISEGAAPDHPAAYWQPFFGIISDATTRQWKEVVDAVTASDGTVFLMQLWHPGALRRVVEGVANPYPDLPSLSPSGLVQSGRSNGVAMSDQDLLDTKDAYVRAARIAQDIGAHGVEVHVAHGYLLDLFLWHETNQRDDRYGGATLAERATYPAEIVAAIREETGPDFIISLRFSQWKEVDYGASIADGPSDLAPFITRMEDAGVDMFHVSTRRFDAPAWPQLDPHRSLASWTKSMTDRAVIANGSVGLSVDMARDLFDGQSPTSLIEQDIDRAAVGLANGDFDLISVGRAHIANPDFVRRVERGELGEMQTFRKEIHLAEESEDYVHDGGVVDESRKTDQS